MIAWLLAAVAGAAMAALAYAGALRAGTAVGAPALLRALAAALLAAAVLDAPLRRAAPPPPLVALDASASWLRAADSAALARARDSARTAGAPPGDSILLVGDSARPAAAGVGLGRAGADAASRAGDAADRAAAAGRPLVLVTDGELADADALRRAPRGSRAVVIRPARGPDAAVVDADAPRAAAAGDTLDVRVVLGADAAGAPAGRVRLVVGARVLADSARPALAPYERRELRLRAALGGASAGAQALRLVSAAPGDREPRNDTLALALDVTDAPAAVFASGAPDYDARLLVGLLRGTLGTPVRAYYRVAPGQWRAEGTLAPVAEADVRRAAAGASVLVLHGDTASLGAPRALGPGALALVQPPAAADSGAEWFAVPAPASPVAGALAGATWDSLPPLDVGPPPRAGDWAALTARRAGGASQAVATGTDGARRVLVVGAGGFWRWQFRGGAPAEAATALWGGLFDWLAAGRGDARAAVPELASVRAGEPVRWRRGGADSVVTVRLMRAGDEGEGDSVVVRFAAGARTAESPALRAGVYAAAVPGGRGLVAVNASPELLPRRPSVAAGPVGGAPVAAGAAAALRDAGWPYAVAAALLCGEWVLRRRRGLR